MRGRYSAIEPSFGLLAAARSLVAIPVYAVGLPFLGLLGQHHLMRYLEKLCHHLGMILGCLRLNPIGTRYVSE
jgi:hypothetical protein